MAWHPDSPTSAHSPFFVGRRMSHWLEIREQLYSGWTNRKWHGCLSGRQAAPVAFVLLNTKPSDLGPCLLCSPPGRQLPVDLEAWGSRGIAGRNQAQTPGSGWNWLPGSLAPGHALCSWFLNAASIQSISLRQPVQRAHTAPVSPVFFFRLFFFKK